MLPASITHCTAWYYQRGFWNNNGNMLRKKRSQIFGRSHGNIRELFVYTVYSYPIVLVKHLQRNSIAEDQCVKVLQLLEPENATRHDGLKGIFSTFSRNGFANAQHTFCPVRDSDDQNNNEFSNLNEHSHCVTTFKPLILYNCLLYK